MINILPEHGRTRLKVAYRLRLAALSLCAAAAACVVAAALMTPAFLDAAVRERAARQEASVVDRLNSESSEAEAPLTAATGYLESYAPILRGAAATERIAAVLSARPSGVRFSTISYTRTGEQVKVSGVAETRERLLAFERALKEDGSIASVDLPVSSLARAVNAPFSITALFKEQAL